MNTISTIGIPVVEHCNINCKGCLHFCHIGQKPYFYDFKTFKKDFKRLRVLFDEINTIRFYGGEPLLHKELNQFIDFAHDLYPGADIEILTNGILLTKMSEDLRNTIIRFNVKICWSVYPIIDEISFVEIREFLDENMIIYKYNKVDEFYTCFDFSGSQNKMEAYEKCSGKYCHVLRNGKISCCPAPLVGHYINQLGADIDFEDGILDIYDISRGEDVIEFLKTPHTACMYCGAPRYFKWEQQNRSVNLDDWKTCKE